MNLYPLLMAPGFRHGESTPWGGSMLRDIFMKEAPDCTGESLEVSVLPERDSLVASGGHAGKTLRRMIELWGEALTGPIKGAFPLTLTLIDARGEKPIHTTVDQARGWVILNAEPGAEVVCGKDEAPQWIPARPGDVFYLPCNTMYALRGGVQCYEIQCLENAPNRPVRTEGATELCKGGSRTWYICDAGFELCRLNISGRMPLDNGRMRIVTPMAPCTLKWADGEMALEPFTTVVVPAGLEDVVIEGHAKALLAAPSDQEKLRQSLGYRSEIVAGL